MDSWRARGWRDCGDDGCLFDVLGDPAEAADLAARLPEVRHELRQLLEAARRVAWVDDAHYDQQIGCTNGCDAECEARWLKYAWEHGAVIQPFAALDASGGTAA